MVNMMTNGQIIAIVKEGSTRFVNDLDVTC